MTAPSNPATDPVDEPAPPPAVPPARREGDADRAPGPRVGRVTVGRPVTEAPEPTADGPRVGTVETGAPAPADPPRPFVRAVPLPHGGQPAGEAPPAVPSVGVTPVRLPLSPPETAAPTQQHRPEEPQP
ncbi:hypothetical protein [Streptomyces sp. NPDC101115]|uniref:hypothetical protein n=1 Tax=Streptomyces sp. NPDC101115 TaxID=3366106 RepID=UPI0038163946